MSSNLLGVCAVMAVGAYAAGALPLCLGGSTTSPRHGGSDAPLHDTRAGSTTAAASGIGQEAGGGAGGAGRAPRGRRVPPRVIPKQIRALTAIGVGLFLSSALAVIIPEGVALYVASLPPDTHVHAHEGAREAGAPASSVADHIVRTSRRLAANTTAASHGAIASTMQQGQQPGQSDIEEEVGVARGERATSEGDVTPGASAPGASAPGASAPAAPGSASAHAHTHGDGEDIVEASRTDALEGGGDAEAAAAAGSDAPTPPPAATHTHVDEKGGAHMDTWPMGAALVLGFAFQLVVDHCAGGGHAHGPGHGHGHGHVNASQPSGRGGGEGGEHARAVCADGASAGRLGGGGGVVSTTSPPPLPPPPSERTCGGTLVGLCVHNAVDGVAMGAALADARHPSLGGIVLLAILMHKAPAAFGYASVMLSQSVPRNIIRSRLAAFAAAAPLATAATYTALAARLFSYTQTSLALAILFSGGTFLYVATAHILPEVQQQMAAARAADAAWDDASGSDDDNDDLEQRVAVAVAAAAAAAAGSGTADEASVWTIEPRAATATATATATARRGVPIPAALSTVGALDGAAGASGSGSSGNSSTGMRTDEEAGGGGGGRATSRAPSRALPSTWRRCWRAMPFAHRLASSSRCGVSTSARRSTQSVGGSGMSNADVAYILCGLLLPLLLNRNHAH